MSTGYTTQNSLLLNKLISFYKENNYLDKILTIINGENKMSLRLIDWFCNKLRKKEFYCIQYSRKEWKK